MDPEQQNQRPQEPARSPRAVPPPTAPARTRAAGRPARPQPVAPAPDSPPFKPAEPHRQATTHVKSSDGLDLSRGDPKPPQAPVATVPASVSRPRPSAPGGQTPGSSSRPRPVGPGEPVLRGPTTLVNSTVSQPPGSRSPNAGRAMGPQPATPPPTVLPATPLSSSSGGSVDSQPPAAQPHTDTVDKAAGETEDFRVHIVTWNVGSAVPPDDIISLLGLNVGDGNTDMYIIGLQEVNSMINKRLKDAIFTDQWSELCMDTLGPFGYVLVTSQRMQGVLLLVFAKYYHLPFLRGVQTESTRTGLGGYWGNKGGVSARMGIFGHKVCFLNCHLPAHMENSEQRMEDFESILQQQQFEVQGAGGVLDHDVVFWFGDLNFRIEDYEMQFVKNAIDGNKLSVLWEKDQLNMAKDLEPVLEGFHEGPLKFPPTYKFDVGTNTYDTSGKKRKPAWTDRILWRIKIPESSSPSQNAAWQPCSAAGLSSGVIVTQHCYRSHMEYLTSDHKPVSAIFTLQFPYRVDVPMVTLTVEDEWNKVSDAIVKFRMAANFPRSSWDWIGLYKVGFKHHKDYVGYVWAKQEEADYLKQEYQATFGEETLPKGSGEYILGYYSNNMSSIVGVTEPFQISLPTSSPSASPSDSSDFSSEDDSTIVLLRPKSRSPSPGKAKQRGRHSRSRSRSPALPRLQGLNLRPRSRETGGNRSPSPRSSAKRERLISDDSPDAVSPASQNTLASPTTPTIEVNAPEAPESLSTGMGHSPPKSAHRRGKASGEAKASGL
ncbi:phosphatidylinositol 4,5-bisphosphate 5-phosphatase A isoform X2 [Amia ocellicauda]|uniref:phosphatidylinositol 4,5-bisphosphate 5-phosphatase A isoform X2 n=1 Tax=Amia ocellicauda TaxID=2972642 RepID=UPI003463D23D